MLRKLLLTCVSVLSCSFLATSCGGGGKAEDNTAMFVGAWTFQSGELAATCLTSTLPPFQLAGLPVTFAKVDDSTISLTLNPQCIVKFAVAAEPADAGPERHATAASGQMCTLDLGGTLGTQSIMITKWTLTLSDDHIDNDIAGSASICMAAGTAVLERGAPDAGVTDAATDTSSGN